MSKEPSNKKTLATDPYKGVRDFYPEDLHVQEYLFETMRDVVEHFGYEEYSASILEPSELYEAKTSEEIVNEQTYSFIDRGDRRVTLRPEMTPSVARMVAAKRRGLAFPLRWYSIPNLFRYERPQRGRLREHWQLNCDLFGISSLEADIEIILLAYEIMRAFGATEKEFEIRVNHRAVIPETLSLLAEQHNLILPKEKQTDLIRLMDRKDKMKPEDYASALRELLGEDLTHVVLTEYTPAKIRKIIGNTLAGKNLLDLLEELEKRGIRNIVHDPHLMRGFDYYTGMIFEVFDTNQENKRALFGGGRYDRLMELFGQDPLPTVGFGVGDVTLRDFLDTHKLLPEYTSATDLYVAVTSPTVFGFAAQLAQRLRRHDLTVAVDFTGKKIGDQVKTATKKNVPFCIVVGEDEAENGVYRLKHLISKQEIMVHEQDIADAVFEALE
ncbi:MAG: histidine--tRNA ligase [Candidatus Pacebacteria bacterium]|nr:histidine--tRNA ligase [Candidatus Paceibacterota bacterium]